MPVAASLFVYGLVSKLAGPCRLYVSQVRPASFHPDFPAASVCFAYDVYALCVGQNHPAVEVVMYGFSRRFSFEDALYARGVKLFAKVEHVPSHGCGVTCGGAGRDFQSAMLWIHAIENHGPVLAVKRFAYGRYRIERSNFFQAEAAIKGFVANVFHTGRN